MKTYKVIPYANQIVVNKEDKPQDAVITYFDVINQECLDGWEFVTVSTVPVIRKRGGLKTQTELYNAFVFSKEIED